MLVFLFAVVCFLVMGYTGNMKRRKSPIETSSLRSTREQKDANRYPNLTGLEDHITFKNIGNNRAAGGAGGDTADTAVQLRLNIQHLNSNIQQGLADSRGVEITKAGDVVIYSAEERSQTQNKEKAKERLNRAIQDAREMMMHKRKKEKRSQEGGKPKPGHVKRKERRNRDYQSKKKQERGGNKVYY